MPVYILDIVAFNKGDVESLTKLRNWLAIATPQEVRYYSKIKQFINK